MMLDDIHLSFQGFPPVVLFEARLRPLRDRNVALFARKGRHATGRTDAPRLRGFTMLISTQYCFAFPSLVGAFGALPNMVDCCSDQTIGVRKPIVWL
jgi:hypothetical protein